MSDNNHKTVGILGGMGPEATVELMRRIIELTPANDDSDHIHMLVDNNPKVPSRIKALITGTGKNPAPELIAMAQGLEKAGADFLVMPCNTAHHYYLEIAESVSIPFINLIDLTAQFIKNKYPNIEKIGLLASSAVIKTGLYKNAFAQHGLKPTYPSETQQDLLMSIIKKVKCNIVEDQVISSFNDIANSINSDCLVIACSELSVIADKLSTHIPIIDALHILAQEVISQAA